MTNFRHLSLNTESMMS